MVFGGGAPMSNKERHQKAVDKEKKEVRKSRRKDAQEVRNLLKALDDK